MSGSFVFRRLLLVLPTIAGIVMLAFLLIHLAPGDPILALAGEHGDADYYAFMRRRFGLDQPWPQQLGTYFVRVAGGDFGYSYVYGRRVLSVIMESIPATLLLTGSALLLAVIVAIPLAAAAARRPHGTRDIGISAVALGLYSVPSFWLAQVAILLVAVRLGLAPVQGLTAAGSDAVGFPHMMDVVRHLALPSLVLASQEVAVLVRLVRSGLIGQLDSDHVRTARAKGAAEHVVLLRHALPRALLPALTAVGARAGHLLAGAVVVEVVFGWPGMGRLLLAALESRDTPILLGSFIVISCAVVLVNFATDLAYAAIDPRIRLR